MADFGAKSTEQRKPGFPPGLPFLTNFLRHLHVQKQPKLSKSNSNESEVGGFGGVVGRGVRAARSLNSEILQYVTVNTRDASCISILLLNYSILYY